MLVTTLKIFASVAFLLTGHLAPCFGDVVSFHRVLANYTSHKHLGKSPNLTSDDQMQRSPATWPSPSESEAFLPYIKYTKFFRLYAQIMPEHAILFTLVFKNYFLHLPDKLVYIF